MNLNNEITRSLRALIVSTASSSREGHVASALSIVDILWVLYDRIMDITPANIDHANRDHFILSKGHASLGLYAVLSQRGFFSKGELGKFASFDGILGGHPDSNKVPGVEASTGSLGHGMPMAVGMAMGMKVKKIDRRVFVLVGDGECNEGSIWESALLASHHRLNNLTCVVDFNHSTDRALGLGDLTAKFSAFGWHAVQIDGHDPDKIFGSLRVQHLDRPLAVVAETIKGKGVKMMENDPAWHHRAPTREELAIILEELK